MPENKMGVMPINKLLFNMSLPPMISMLAVALYNIIDSIFVAMVSEDALTAVTLVFPVQMLMNAVIVGTGVGLASLISRRLGEKRQDEAESAAAHGFVFALVIWILFALFGIFLAEPFLRFFTGDGNESILQMAMTYCRIVMIGSVSICFSITIEKILQATGNTFQPMLFNIIGLGTNCVLAPILIIGYLGAPRLEVAGAGYAAIIGQTVGLAVALIIFLGKSHAVKVSLKGFHLKFETVRDILVVGAPTIVMQAVMPILISFLNKLLFSYTSAVFVLGVYYRISTFAILPVLGLNQGALPIMGYNFGAKNRLRLMQAFKSAFKVAIIIMIVCVAIFWIFPERIMMLFSASEATMDLGVHALRIVSLSWLPGAYVIIAIGLFQAMAHGVFALIISIVRQIGFIMPLAWILLTYFGIYAVWYSYPLAEIASFTLAVLFFRRVYIREIKKLPDGAPIGGIIR